MTTVVWWIRRDLRLHDNQALATALRQANQLVPLFVLDPHLLATSPRRVAFLFQALKSLDQALRQRGSRLILRYGDPTHVIPAIVRESQAARVVAEADYTPYARQRDQKIAREVQLLLTPGLTIQPVEHIRTPEGEPYLVFSAFAKTWARHPLPSPPSLHPAPEWLPPCSELPSDPLPNSPAQFAFDHFPPSEEAARRRLYSFCEHVLASYAHARNRLDGKGSSQLSPYFRFGLLSAREAWVTINNLASTAEYREGAQAWLNELVWRDFYHSILAAFPESVERSLRPELRDRSWPGSSADFEAWANGMTGYPVIDATMRQLRSEGWISNRARMVVANFLTKILLVDWRMGERLFRRELIDGDLAANVGGWQWAAGTGTDAAPFFRIFNPVRQGEQFDPSGEWVRTWLPELREVPTEFIFAPWRMPLSVQQRSGCRIGRDYPAPIVDFTSARQRALAWYPLAYRRRDE